jgi:thioredoxin-related protein
MKTLLRTFAVLVASASLSLAAAEGWMTDWEAAKAKAKAENKPILINLTGSDWCTWCIKIEKEVFSTKEFQEFAAKHLVLMEADFPKKKELPAELKKQNAELKKQYLNGGYPTVYLLDAEGKKLSEDIGELKGGTAEYLKTITGLIEKSKAE